MKLLFAGADRIIVAFLVIWAIALEPFASVEAIGHKWDIEPANVTYDQETDIFTMKYGLDPTINETENLRVEILLPNCSYPILGVEDGIVSDYINASGYHIFEVHPQTMSTDDRLFNYSFWENTTNPNAIIKLCVHATLWTGPESNPDAVQVSALETIVTLFIDLSEDFEIDGVNTDRKDETENEKIEQEDFDVFAYFCDPFTRLETDPSPVTAGQLITVCVEVTEETLSDGVYIDYIEEFVWIRNNTNGYADITQWVIKNAEVMEPLITSYECASPTIVCDFSMFMWPVFFALPGNAIGAGKARLAFGDPDTNPTTRSRKSRILWKQPPDERMPRKLQDRSIGPGAFGLDLTLREGGNLPRLKTAAGVSLGKSLKSLSALASYSAVALLVLF